jgi:hypothetical protein
VGDVTKQAESRLHRSGVPPVIYTLASPEQVDDAIKRVKERRESIKQKNGQTSNEGTNQEAE